MCLGNCVNILEELNQTKLTVLNSEGIFERFLETYLDILSTAFTSNKLIKYCRMMRTELKKMHFTYTERLSKHFKFLSKMDRDDIVDEVAAHKRQFDEKLPKRQEFFDAIRSAFNLQHRLKFDDYLHDLLAFGKGDLLLVSIQEQTRKLLDMIIDCVHKLDLKMQRALEKTLKIAIKEHKIHF